MGTAALEIGLSIPTRDCRPGMPRNVALKLTAAPALETASVRSAPLKKITVAPLAPWLGSVRPLT